MNKKLMAVAVAGAFAAPGLALAQSSTVQIGGNLSLVYFKNNPNTALSQSNDQLNMSEPSVFIAGSEKLGGGLTTWFRCESTMDLVGGAATATGFCTRNSAIGLRGGFGNVFAGNWDAPGKDAFNRARGWFGGTAPVLGVAGNLLLNGAASGLASPVPNIGGTGTAGGARAASFFRRQSNSWNYHSPSWNGFQVKGQFSSTNQVTGVPAANPLKPRMYSLSGAYDSGPLFVVATYENHTDYNPGTGVSVGVGALQTGGGDDDAWSLSAGYRFGNQFSLRGVYTDMSYKPTNTTTLDHKGWGIYGDWHIQGPHTLRAHYARVGDTKGNHVGLVGNSTGNAGVGGTGGKTWAAAYSYSFSKRTEASFIYRKVKNDINTATYGTGVTTATSLGGSQTAYGLNVRHRF